MMKYLRLLSLFAMVATLMLMLPDNGVSAQGFTGVSLSLTPGDTVTEGTAIEVRVRGIGWDASLSPHIRVRMNNRPETETIAACEGVGMGAAPVVLTVEANGDFSYTATTDTACPVNPYTVSAEVLLTLTPGADQTVSSRHTREIEITQLPRLSFAASDRDATEDFDTLISAGNNAPLGIWSDGTTMWVSDSVDDKIYAYDLNTKARDATEDFNTLDSAGNENPIGLWSDGTTMWVADPTDDKIYAYDLNTKARDATEDFNTLAAAGNRDSYGIWSDGTTMWVADNSDDEIYAYDLNTKARDATEDFDTLGAAGNNAPVGSWSDGTTMWVADNSDNKIYAYNLSTKARDAAKDFDTLDAAGNDHLFGIWSDGMTMWVADNTDGKLYAYEAYVSQLDDPTGLSSTAQTSTTLTFGWSAVSDADNYGYQYKKATATPWETEADTTGTSVVVTGLDSFVEYDFQVRAKSTSATASAYVATTGTTLLGIPQSVVATGRTTDSLTFDWADTTGATSYGHQHREAGAGTWGAETTVTVSEATVTLLDADTSYEFQVRAKNATDTSGYSAEATGQTEPEDSADSYGYVPSENITVPAIGTVIDLWADQTYWYILDGSTANLDILRVDRTDGTQAATFDLFFGNARPRSLWSDGSLIYVTDTQDNHVYTYDLTTGTRTTASEFGTNDSSNGNTQLKGIWGNSDHIYIADSADDKIYAYDSDTKAADATADFDSFAPDNGSAWGIWSDGDTMWVLDSLDNKIYAYDSATKAADATKDIDFSNEVAAGKGRGIWSDGTHIWVVANGDSTIYAYNMDTSPTPPPATPSGVTVSGVTTSAMTFGWNAVAEATSYGYQYREDGDTVWPTEVLTTATSVTLSSLDDNQTYEFQVRATNSAGSSAYTNPVEGTTLEVVPPTLTVAFSPSAEVASGTAITVTITGNHMDAYQGMLYAAEVKNFDTDADVDSCEGTGLGSTLAFGTDGAEEREVTGSVPATCADGAYKLEASVYVGSQVGTTLLVAEERFDIGATAPPDVPTGLSSTATTSTIVSLNWDDMDTAVSYDYQKKRSNLNTFDTAVEVNVSQATVGNLLSGQSYDFQVRATNSQGDSNWSASLVVVTNPPTPSGLSVDSTTASSALIGWDVVSSATGYQYRYKKNSEQAWGTASASQTGRTATITGLDAGTLYNFQVRAENASGFSVWAVAANGTTNPALPANLRATGQTVNSITFEWNDVTGADRYEYQHRVNGTLAWSAAESVITSTATVGMLQSGTTYDFQVKAVNDGGESAYAPHVEGTTSLASATNIRITGVTATTITLDWADIVGGDGYEYRFKQQGTPNFGQPVAVTASTATVSNLTAGTTYEFEVRGTVTSGGTFPWSSATSATTIPPAPSGIAQTAATTASVTFEWNQTNGATSHDYEYRLRGVTPWETTVNTTALTALISGLDAGTTYEFQIRARNSGGAGVWATAVDGVTRPGIPQAVALDSADTDELVFTWDEVDGADIYVYQHKLNGTQTWGAADTSTSESATLSNLSANTTYDFRVKARNAGGDGDWAADVQGMTDLAAPAVPTGLTVVSTTATTAVFDWADISGADDYDYQYRESGGSWPTAVTVTVSTVTLTGLTAGTTYDLRVLASNSAGDSSYTSEVEAVTNPAQPASITSASSSATQLTFGWPAVTGADSYVYQHKRDVDQAWSAESTTTAVSVTITSLTGDTTYDFRVKARNDGGDSLWTATFATTQLPIPLRPTNLDVIDVTATTITIDWDDMAYATGYEYQYREDGDSWPASGTAVAASTVIVLGLDSGTEYDFRVKAINGSGGSAYTSFTSDYTLLATPTGLSITGNTATSVTLDWDDVTGATGYHYQTKEGTAQNWSSRVSVNTSTVTVSGLTSGIEHDFRVRATGSNSNNSEWTQPISDTTDLRTPTGLYVASRTETSVTLEWNAVSSAGNYQVQWREVGAGTAWLIRTAVSLTEDQITGLTSGKTYEAQVRARNSSAESLWSASRNFITAVGAPLGVRLIDRELTSLSFAWNTVEGGERYYYQWRSEENNSWGSTSSFVTTNQVTIGGLVPNGTYTFRVRAWTQQTGFSGYSARGTGTTRPPVPFSRTASHDFNYSDLLNGSYVPATGTGLGTRADYLTALVWGGFRTNRDMFVGYRRYVYDSVNQQRVTLNEIIGMNPNTFGFDDSIKIGLTEENANPSDFVVIGQDVYVCDSTDTYVYVYDLSSGAFSTSDSFDLEAGHRCDAMATDGSDVFVVYRTSTYVNTFRAYDRYSGVYSSGDDVAASTTYNATVQAAVSDGAGGFYYYFPNTVRHRDSAGTVTTQTASSAITNLYIPATAVHLHIDPIEPTLAIDGATDPVFNTHTMSSTRYFLTDRSQPVTDFNVLPVNNDPTGIHVDGDVIYVADGTTRRIYAYDVNSRRSRPDKSLLISYAVTASYHPRGIWSDDTTMWMAFRHSTSSATGRLLGIDATTSELLDLDKDGDKDANDYLHLYRTGNSGTRITPTDMWGKGASVFVVDTATHAVLAYDTFTGNRIDAEDWTAARLTTDGVDEPSGIWSDGTTMWISDTDDDQIYAFILDTQARDSEKDFDNLRTARNFAPNYISGNGSYMWATDEANLAEQFLFAYTQVSSETPAFFTANVPLLEYDIFLGTREITIKWGSLKGANGYDLIIDNSLPLTMRDALTGSLQTYTFVYEAGAEVSTVAVRGRVCADDDEAVTVDLDDGTPAIIPVGQCSYTAYSETLVIRIAAISDIVRELPEGIAESVQVDNRVALAIGELLELGGAVEDSESYNTRTWLPPIAFFIAIGTAGMLIWLTSGGAGITPAGVFIGAIAFTIIFGIIGPLMLDVPIAMAAASLLLPLIGGIFILKTRS